MSDIYSIGGDAKGGIRTYIVDDVGDGSIDRAIKLLSGIPHGASKAIGSAIKRAATSGEAYAAKVIRGEYYISAGDFKKYTQAKRQIVSGSGSTTVNITFRGTHVPLLKFNTKIDRSGRVVTRVKRSSSSTVLKHVFKRSVGMSGHEGIFERFGDSRLPIEEKFGPSTPQMMDYNDDISQQIGDKVRETFDARLPHEIEAVLNGYR